ncbi:NAD(+)/NADH kinase [Candidatus Woesearchaeota archaeon]|nr:NAD(+)/NADH kinase [Candidatus Woesearchaeota archaeon]
MKIKNVLLVYTPPRAKEEMSCFSLVQMTLKKNKISCHLANMDMLNPYQFKAKDMIITVGGDGTFLRAAQFVDGQIILGVNSDYRNKEGFFLKSDKRNFSQKLEKILDGNFKIKEFPRLEASIDGKKTGALALNEFFIGPRKSYHAAKYIIKMNDKSERQKSSGILVTTPAGSYAWASACHSKKLPLDSSNFQFIVREPYEGKVFRNYQLKYGVLNDHQGISIISEMMDGILIADSVGKEYGLKNGSVAAIRLSSNHLKIVWF